MTRSLLFLHAQPGRGAELLRVLERLGVLAVASEQPGFLGVEVAASVDDADEIVIVGSWASRSSTSAGAPGRCRAAARADRGLLTTAP